MTAPVEVRHLLHRWADSINRGAAHEVAALYAEEGVFLPTFSAETCYTHQAIEGYFRTLAEQGGQVSLDEASLVVQALGERRYVLSGRYVFRIGDAGVRPAQFTLVVDCKQTRSILHHHSSQVPTGT